jgi:transketolase
VSFGWARWADDSVSIDHFGASGPGAEVLAAFGFTPESVATRATMLLDSIDGVDDYEDAEDEL